MIMSDIKLNFKQISQMKHCIGFDERKRSVDGKYFAYRNYFSTPEPDDDWDELVYLGLAGRGDSKRYTFYSLTKKGIKYLEILLSLKITEID